MEPVHFESLYPAKTRFSEIKKIIEILRSGRAVQVAGVPGVGKGNILRLLSYNHAVRKLHLGKDEARFHFIYMDFSEVRSRPLFDIMKFIFISLSYSLGERKFETEQEKVNEFLREALEFDDELIMFQGLKKSVDFLVAERGLRLVFLFDRFEEYIPNIDGNFFVNLRILRNRAKYSFQTVFAVRRPIEDILDPALLSDFYEFIVGNTIYLPIKDAEGLAFRFKHLEEITGKKAPDSVKHEIERLTGGHGQLTKLSYEVVLAADSKPGKNIEQMLLDTAQIKTVLLSIWQVLAPSEQDDLLKNEKNEFLEKINLCENGKITIPLFAKFLSTVSASSVESPKITFNPERNDILENGISIAGKLTPYEFRLLRFLISNKDRVCEKDEIIENVWKDTKTREGVTDQALDQIIYRLRKKIESDPNNPKFVQTIKGRGYKFNE